MRIRKFAAAAVLGLSALALSACATSLPTKVTRFSAAQIPAGQSFYVVPADGAQGGLEFGRYAQLVSQHLQARGYQPAGAPQVADLLVKVSYGVDEGEREYRVDPIARSRMHDPFYRRGFYDPFFGVSYGHPYYSRFGYYGRYRDPFYWGSGDPFYYDPYSSGFGYGRYGGYGGYGYGGRGSVREYTVYESELDLDIVRRADNLPLFEGKAQARSATDELGVLVPNLVEAMFTGFPGRNGETVKITVPARRN